MQSTGLQSSMADDDDDSDLTTNQRLTAFALLIFSIFCYILSIYIHYSNFSDLYALGLLGSFTATLCLSLAHNFLTLYSSNENSVISNAAAFTLYSSFMYSSYIKSYKKYSAPAPVTWIKQLETATGLELAPFWRKIWSAQQRISNFFFSFIMDRGYNI